MLSSCLLLVICVNLPGLARGDAGPKLHPLWVLPSFEAICTRCLPVDFNAAWRLHPLSSPCSNVSTMHHDHDPQVLPLQLPSLDVDVRTSSVPPVAQAYLAGLVFALAASPCSTPVLATLLAYVASTRDPLQGSALLLAYTSGYVAPLLVAASFTVSAARHGMEHVVCGCMLSVG